MWRTFLKICVAIIIIIIIIIIYILFGITVYLSTRIFNCATGNKRKPEMIIYSTNKTKDKFPSPTNWRYGTPCMWRRKSLCKITAY